MITIYFDGLCEPINPGGIATYGYVIIRDGVAIKKGCRAIGSGVGMTNNVAEYSGLLRAIEWINEEKINEDIIVKGDSQLVINQMKGIWRIKSETSKHFVPKINNLIKNRKISYHWIPREKNNEADMLSRVAYKRYRKKQEE